jgi:hypothetical protein
MATTVGPVAAPRMSGPAALSSAISDGEKALSFPGCRQPRSDFIIASHGRGRAALT